MTAPRRKRGSTPAAETSDLNTEYALVIGSSTLWTAVSLVRWARQVLMDLSPARISSISAVTRQLQPQRFGHHLQAQARKRDLGKEFPVVTWSPIICGEPADAEQDVLADEDAALAEIILENSGDRCGVEKRSATEADTIFGPSLPPCRAPETER
jgi:hypothetical protein